jgi:uncharacterized protein (DUF1501 family)
MKNSYAFESLADLPLSPVRRKLILGSAALATRGAGAFALAMQGAIALAQTAQDYKALVCVFLYGGNDHGNTVVPYGTTEYNRYVDGRGGLARARADLLPITAASVQNQQLSLPVELDGLRQLYNLGKLAILGNVGVLTYPVTKAQVLNGTVELPPQLRSHVDHQDFWQSGVPSYSVATGWAGRIADLVAASNAGSVVPSVLSLSGTNRWQIGNQAFPFSLSLAGASTMSTQTDPVRGQAFASILAQSRTHPMEAELTRIYSRSATASAAITSSLNNAPNVDAYWAGVPASNNLAAQLKVVARLIAVRSQLGQRRQVYFVGAGGFDNHNDLGLHARLLKGVSDALVGFQAAVEGLGVGSNVTTFTASDFGRRLMTNGGGSDHGWGGHHFIMGGAVNGGNVYGNFPVIARNGPDDYYDGVLVPTTSVDQYGSTLARWFGVSVPDLPIVMPNIGRFSTTDLGFMKRDSV